MTGSRVPRASGTSWNWRTNAVASSACAATTKARPTLSLMGRTAVIQYRGAVTVTSVASAAGLHHGDASAVSPALRSMVSSA